jgi:hypothetical protein
MSEGSEIPQSWVKFHSKVWKDPQPQVSFVVIYAIGLRAICCS